MGGYPKWGRSFSIAAISSPTGSSSASPSPQISDSTDSREAFLWYLAFAFAFVVVVAAAVAVAVPGFLEPSSEELASLLWLYTQLISVTDGCDREREPGSNGDFFPGLPPASSSKL